MTKRMALISWGRSYDRTYLAIPVDKVGVIMDIIAHGEVLLASDYSIGEKTTFETDEHGTTLNFSVVDASRLEPPTPEEEADDAAAEAATASSDLELRIEEAQAGDPPAELAS